MSGKYLVVGLMTEGLSDELLLGQVISRQLRELSFEHPGGFALGDLVMASVRTVDPGDRVQAEVTELLDCCDVVVVHCDHRERGKIDAFRSHAGEAGRRIVGIAPRKETEAWALCDPEGFRRIPRTDLTALPGKAREVESVLDPKTTLKTVLGARDPMTVLRQLGIDLRLDRLAGVPAYQAWLAQLKNVLKELHFL
ncbi:hypothetical protein OG455_14090 [Kitasatospora sp. NBC_01287]|uniref:hypothetical protein n=1 Tax=Kitasatospora sp. NBC_01287 TaxID=2903573 RepID=UPI0022531178|nr:hypothetical protein [Kitasatospora sp. NBC_01287]MCX4746635.1 hypothetical protein [Kitasatospora sp. NBC_01287]